MQEIPQDAYRFDCEKHNKRIEYFCCANQWHFVPLCGQCLPSHTQTHPKNIKVTIQSLSNVVNKYNEQKDKGVEMYEKKKQQITQQINQPKEISEFSKIEKARNKIHLLIDHYFDFLKKEIELKRKQTQNYQKQLLVKLLDNVSVDIEELRNSDQIKDINIWAQQAKRIYFKDGAKIYIEEIQQILKDHQQRLYNRDDVLLNQDKMPKVQQQIRNSLKTLIHIKLQKPKEQINPKMKQKKKTSKIVNKPKICKYCGSELQYLTEWKKHLICPNCGGKQRNYTKKG